MNSEIVQIFLPVILQGLIYSIVVMGVYLSSRVIRFDDLTTEGSFGLGGALSALCIVSNIPAWQTLPLAMLAGGVAGACTGLLHTKCKMNNLISGLVVTTALFSICLKLASANLPLPENATVFPKAPLFTLFFLIAIVSFVYLGIKKILRSELGLFFTAVGSNPQVVTSLSKSVDGYKIAGLSLANSLTALAGCLFVQWSGFFSITGNIGTLVTGIAGLILAEMIRPKFGISLILGAILYQAIFAITIELELPPIWNNFIKAALIVLFVQLRPKKAILQR